VIRLPAGFTLTRGTKSPLNINKICEADQPHIPQNSLSAGKLANFSQNKIKCFSPEGRKATLIIHSSSAKRFHSSLFIQNPLKINE